MPHRPHRALPLLVVLTAVAWGTVADANHAWGSYHWRNGSGQLTLSVGDNVSSGWDTHLLVALADWNVSTVLQLQHATGGTKPKSCRPIAGRIEVCSERYGNTGWLGIAQIWASGSHITQAVAKMNDTYFNTATYNTGSWRQLVMCQEIAHDFGLDHQDENFNNPNLGSCMDYTSSPAGNEHPNAHDYDQLEDIYLHVDGGAGGGGAAAATGADVDSPGQWGQLVRANANGRVQIYERDLGRGQKVITHVFWADPDADRAR